MSDLRLVLHPGHPKCGSSSIQHALFSNIESLKERGVFVPERRPNRVFMQACMRQDFAIVREWLNATINETREASCHTVVISAENLGVRRLVTDGRPIHELFRESFKTVDVFYYIRRQDDYMVSQWQQWGHKQGLALEDFISERLQDNTPDYIASTAAFDEIYGSDKVAVVPLHERALLGGDVLSDFASRSTLEPLPVADEDRRRNVSMGGYLCDVLSRVPKVYDPALVSRSSEGITDSSVRNLLARSVRSTDLLFNGDKRIMSAKQRRRVMGHFAEDNERLHARFFDTVDIELIFGLSADDEDALKALSDRVDGLRDVVAIQMDLILTLLKQAEGGSPGNRIKDWARSVAKRLKPSEGVGSAR